MGNTFCTAPAVFLLGLVAHSSGDYGRADEYFREARYFLVPLGDYVDADLKTALGHFAQEIGLPNVLRHFIHIRQKHIRHAPLDKWSVLPRACTACTRTSRSRSSRSTRWA